MGKSGRVVAVAVVAFGLCAVAVFFLFGPWKAPGGVHALAVLPLKSSAGSTEDDALGRAISDSLIRRFRATGAVAVSPAAAERTRCLRGPCAARADSSEFEVQLLRAGDGRMLWKESFDVPASDAHAVENAIFEAVSSRLRLK